MADRGHSLAVVGHRSLAVEEHRNQAVGVAVGSLRRNSLGLTLLQGTNLRSVDHGITCGEES